MRSLFTTENGYIGTSMPSSIMPGLEVWLLFGGRVLYVLQRREYGCHLLIGECYIHGYMGGEAYNLWKEGKLKDEWVDIE